MDRPIAFQLLRKEELQYEVEIRDTKPGVTVDVLRVQIRDLARTMPSDEVIETSRDPSEELKVILSKLDEVNQGLSDETLTYKAFNRLRAISHHIYHRLSRIETSADIAATRASAQSQLDAALERVDRRFRVFSASFEEPITVPTVNQPSTSDPAASPIVVQCSNSSHEKAISRLNLKFNGLTCVRSFLLRLTELCETRSIDDDVLFHGAAELFTGFALTWFRSVKPSLTSWSVLKSSLVEEFSPFDFDDRLLAEIRSRTQGASESVAIYIAIMINYFNLLSRPLPESEQLKIIRFNLRPNYITALALEDIDSIAELKRKCKILEYNFFRATGFTEPPKSSDGSLAPDLAYKLKAPVKVEVVEAPKEFCVRCRVNGHALSSCKSKDLVCFGCGTKGYRRPSCPNCSPRSAPPPPEKTKN